MHAASSTSVTALLAVLPVWLPRLPRLPSPPSTLSCANALARASRVSTTRRVAAVSDSTRFTWVCTSSTTLGMTHCDIKAAWSLPMAVSDTSTAVSNPRNADSTRRRRSDTASSLFNRPRNSFSATVSPFNVVCAAPRVCRCWRSRYFCLKLSHASSAASSAISVLGSSSFARNSELTSRPIARTDG